MTDTVKRELQFSRHNRYDADEQRIISNFVNSANARGYKVTYSNLNMEDAGEPDVTIANGGLNVDFSEIGFSGSEDEYLRVYDADKRFIGIVALDKEPEPVTVATDCQEDINEDLLIDLVESAYARLDSIDVVHIPSRFSDSEISSIESVIENGLANGYEMSIRNRTNERNEVAIEKGSDIASTVKGYGKYGVPALIRFKKEGSGISVVQATPTYDDTDNVPFLALRRAFNPEAASEINDFIENDSLIRQFVKNAKSGSSTPEM